ncbi:STAS domain-containing protein [Shewanella avicenniae]|uniref:STAS domain-containing protein n=1 Tax=Shewanella avicenniae TaxID=2814294 RepID=A0ABX7QNZ4_9GAMM|nr:STAS domain-containing protein [Shewanella avicenniae]QSX33194.1 STAS domain-containing protein [Shewanella avicenniae]
MLKHDVDQGVNVVLLEGEMTIYDIEALAQALLPLIGSAEQLVIDLNSVSEIDSSGAQLLMLARIERQRLGRPFSMVNHSASVLRLFESLGLLNWFDDPVVLSGNV